MSHKADGKPFQGKGFTHHVVNNSCAVAGFKDEESAKQDAEARNEKAVGLGIDGNYHVEPVTEATYVDHKDK